MDLRDIKTEVHSLADIEKDLSQFKTHWIKPIRSNTNQHLPFLNDLNQDAKDKINQALHKLQDTFKNIHSSQMINYKLQQYSRYLIELKLTTFNGDDNKSQMITNQFINDDFLNIKQTLTEIKQFDTHVKSLQHDYDEVNGLLQKHLSLEEMLFYLDLPHRLYLINLVKTSQKQKQLAQKIGAHAVSLIKETQFVKKRKG